jgi:DNA-binding response OmpR family regulator
MGPEMKSVGAGLRILIVEDEALVGQTLGRCLVRRGHVVRLAGTALEAETLAHGSAFDCGVFDVEVGKEDGIELAARLLRCRLVRAAVFFTGTADDRKRHFAGRLGSIADKGVSFEELARLVEGAMALK